MSLTCIFKNYLAAAVCGLFLIAGAIAASAAENAPVQIASRGSVPENAVKPEDCAYSLDFSKAPKGPARKWLKKRGFQFKKDAYYPNRMDFEFTGNGLRIGANSHVFGLILKKLNDGEFSKIRITWSIEKYPKGANYNKKINNEALMIYVFFGEKKLPSGNFFMPASPYFIGMFLGKNEIIRKAYLGRHYHHCGRFVCLGNPQPGRTITSEFNLTENFKKYFKKNNVPEISGITFGVDTSGSETGKSGAIIKKLEFYK